MDSQHLDPGSIELFDQALKALLVTLQPTHESDAARKQVVSDMQQLVTTALPQELHCGVETFGSYRAGLHLPGSDLDFALTGWVTRSSPPENGSFDSADENGDGHDDDHHQRYTVSCVDHLEPCDSRQQMHEQQHQRQADQLQARGRWGDAEAAAQQREKQQRQTQQDERVELHQWTRLDQECLLADLATALEERRLVQGQVERVLNARVPVIKFTHQGTGLQCDFSISRPECAFKAEMQKLLGSLDRRYAALYRLVKMWAAAHGLNDAASSTLNSWSLGLMVAFYMQCEQPALLPPIWQLLERHHPSPRSPRVLQQPNIDSATLKRTLSLAATGAGAYASRRVRLGAAGINQKSLAELLLGFFEFYGSQMVKWVAGESKRRRASAWWGRWSDAPWPPGKPYIFSVEDPFNSEDNTARSVGTHNILSCLSSASYIAWAVQTSASLVRQALGDQPAANVDSSSSSTPSQQVLAAYCWLFGPTAVLQLPQQQQRQVELPLPLQDCLQHHVPTDVCQQLVNQLQSMSDNCIHVLADSSCIACLNSNNRSAADDQRIEEIEHALQMYKKLLKLLHAPVMDVCMRDHRIIYKREQELAARQREQQRQRRKQEREQQQRHAMQQRQQQQQQQGPQQQGVVRVVPRQQSAPQMQQREVVPLQRRSKSGTAADAPSGAAADAAAAAVHGLGALQQSSRAVSDGGRPTRPASAASLGTGTSSRNRRQHAAVTSKPATSAANGFAQVDLSSDAAAAGNSREMRAERRRVLQPYLPVQDSDNIHREQYNNSSTTCSSIERAGFARAVPPDGFDAPRPPAVALPAPPAAGGLQLARAALQGVAAQGATSSNSRGRGRGRGRGNPRLAPGQQQGVVDN